MLAISKAHTLECHQFKEFKKRVRQSFKKTIFYPLHLEKIFSFFEIKYFIQRDEKIRCKFL